jgi:hypothetical protein
VNYKAQLMRQIEETYKRNPTDGPHAAAVATLVVALAETMERVDELTARLRLFEGPEDPKDDVFVNDNPRNGSDSAVYIPSGVDPKPKED